MDDLFNILSSSARIDKSQRSKKRSRESGLNHNGATIKQTAPRLTPLEATEREETSRDRTGKRDLSEEKLAQVHREQVLAFRRCMNIRLGKQHQYDNDIPDPISSFDELAIPIWWTTKLGNNDKDDTTNKEDHSFRGAQRAILRNIEGGFWKEPTPVQMQAIPVLLNGRRDVMASAPTGSGKSGAFILPALLLGSAPHSVFYGGSNTSIAGTKKQASQKQQNQQRAGEIRTLILAPSLELAAQLHREVERLGQGKPGGISALLLSKANASLIIAGQAGGKQGLDCLVSTPLRLVDSIQKGLKLLYVRLVVLDEADRLLDATDTGRSDKQSHVRKTDDSNDSGESDDEKNDSQIVSVDTTSGSRQSQTFLSQMDTILSEVPSTAVRALFSATLTPTVRMLSESILRSPVDMTIASSGAPGGANPDITQELMFVGREEGKLLAIRQLVARGQLRPPVLIFLESQDRAHALFSELLYDGLHVDVIHAGRSKAARERTVQSFRKGETWVLIGTDLVARGVDFRAVNMVINYDLPTSGVTYVHRIGRTGRAGRKGKAITLFTEADFDNLRTIANVMKQSGCEVPDWMLNRKKGAASATKGGNKKQRRAPISTTPLYDKKKRHQKAQMVQHSMAKKVRNAET